MHFFRLMSSAAQAVMKPYNKLSPELRTQFQDFLHHTFGKNQLRLTDLSSKLIVQVSAPSSASKKDTELTTFIEGLKSRGVIDYKIEKKISSVGYGEDYGQTFYHSTFNITAGNPRLLEETLKTSAAEASTSTSAAVTSPSPRK